MWTEPPVVTINPTRLDKGAVDWDGTVYNNGMCTDTNQHAVSDAGRFIADEHDGFLMPSPKTSSRSNYFSPNLARTDTMVDALPVDDTGEMQQGNSGSDASLLLENANSPSDPCMDVHGQKSSNFLVGLPTPPSDSHSPGPAMRLQTMPRAATSEPLNAGNSKRHKLARRKVQKSHQKSRSMTNPTSGIDILHELDPRLQDALKCGQGLVRDDLPAFLDQNFNIWQEEGCRSNKPFTLVSASSTEEKVAQVFQHVHSQQEQQLDEKLGLLFSRALLFLSFETLKRETEQDMHHGQLENPHGKQVATLAVDRLLKNCYPERWDLMSSQEKRYLRDKFHEYKRLGSRYCQAAGVLGLGALLGAGKTLNKVM